MIQFIKAIRTPVLALMLLAGFSIPTLLLSPSASAVDIFNNCTKTSTSASEKAACNDCTSSVASQSDYCKEAASQAGNPIIHIIKLIINLVSYLAGAAAIIALIVSGLRFVLANGDSNSITAARNGVLYALIGIGVVVVAQGIVVFVLNKVK